MRKGNTYELLIAFVLWYGASTICNSSSRRILEIIPTPMYLSLFQFVIALGLSSIRFQYVGTSPEPITPDHLPHLTRVTLVYTVGFLFVNAGYVVINVSLAETLRSAEPLISVLLAICFLKEEKISYLTLWSMIPIVVGGALSSFGDGTFTLVALLFVMISNLCFSLRSVYTKKMCETYAGDSYSLFYHISKMGLYALLLGNVVLEFFYFIGIKSTYISLAPHRVLWESKELIPMILLNGSTYWLYNQMSYVVLSKVEMVTHAVGNAFRRVVTILFSVWYFQNEISLVNGIGIFLAFSGVVMYTISKIDRETTLPK